MPLVRIDLRKGKDAAYRQAVGRAVYEALISVGVPQNDRFQVALLSWLQSAGKPLMSVFWHSAHARCSGLAIRLLG